MLIEIEKLPCACHASLIVVAAFPQTLRRHTSSSGFTLETVCCFLFPSRASGKSQQWHHQDTAKSVGAFHFGTHRQLQTQRDLSFFLRWFLLLFLRFFFHFLYFRLIVSFLLNCIMFVLSFNVFLICFLYPPLLGRRRERRWQAPWMSEPAATG